MLQDGNDRTGQARRPRSASQRRDVSQRVPALATCWSLSVCHPLEQRALPYVDGDRVYRKLPRVVY